MSKNHAYLRMVNASMIVATACGIVAAALAILAWSGGTAERSVQHAHRMNRLLTRMMLTDVVVGIERHVTTRGALPSDATLFDDLCGKSNGRPAILEPRERWRDHNAIVDAWNNAMVYRPIFFGGGFSIYSSGPNGVDDSGRGDDVVLPPNREMWPHYAVPGSVDAIDRDQETHTSRN